MTTTVDTPMYTPSRGVLIDPLRGVARTWAEGTAPIWDELCAELGNPLTGAPSDNGRDVVEGVVL